MLRRFIITSISLLALVVTPASFAQDENPPANEKPTLSKTSSPRAVRLAIVNGIIDFVNNARRQQLL